MSEFDCNKYLGRLTLRLDDGAHNLTDERRAIVKKQMAKHPHRPRTLGDHQKLEAVARALLDNRINNPMGDTPELADLGDDRTITTDDVIGSTGEIRQWGADMILDCKIWEFVTADLMDAYDLSGTRRASAA
jgi:hypothetical protein